MMGTAPNSRSRGLAAPLAALLALLIAAPAAAATLTPDRVHDELELYIRDRLPESVSSVAVDGINLDEPVPVPDGELALRFRPRPGEDFVGRTVVSMDVMSGNDLVQTRNLSFRVTGNVAVWTVSTSIGRGQEVRTASLTADLRDMDSLPVDAVMADEDLGTSVASRDLAHGTVLCRSMMRRLPDLERGEPVVVEIRTGPLSVSCMGSLQENGFVGEPVRARCEDTSALISGRLEADGRVVMTLPSMMRVGGER